MAWNFAAQIHALTGFDADDDSTATETGDTFSLMADRWLVDAAKEIINMMPMKMKYKCSTVTNLYIGNTNTTMDLDGVGDVLQVTRENADSGYYTPCRQIEPWQGDLSNDSSSLHYATATDPVYWIESNSSNASTLFVKPTVTAAQPAKVVHVTYPPNSTSFSTEGSLLPTVSVSIDNFPDEFEHLVVLRASITAAEYMLMTEEDPEIYLPMIQNLKQDLNQGLQALGVGVQQPQQGGG
tara:strand:+ start:73 stop:789 length:717 start_codon:yes stop_codon:yes gene_type:complete